MCGGARDAERGAGADGGGAAEDVVAALERQHAGLHLKLAGRGGLEAGGGHRVGGGLADDAGVEDRIAVVAPCEDEGPCRLVLVEAAAAAEHTGVGEGALVHEPPAGGEVAAGAGAGGRGGQDHGVRRGAADGTGGPVEGAREGQAAARRVQVTSTAEGHAPHHLRGGHGQAPAGDDRVVVAIGDDAARPARDMCPLAGAAPGALEGVGRGRDDDEGDAGEGGQPDARHGITPEAENRLSESEGRGRCVSVTDIRHRRTSPWAR